MNARVCGACDENSYLGFGMMRWTWLILAHFGSNRRRLRQVIESLNYYQAIRYELIAFCIMPNHVHILFTPLQNEAGIITR
ncbi:MAG: transposase [Caldilineaceae bacterium]|nr:transposase [Caldilineaceae bacterium]